ncbi:hypothetical protein L9F63_009300, partial [Diploptera punctata]
HRESIKTPHKRILRESSPSCAYSSSLQPYKYSILHQISNYNTLKIRTVIRPAVSLIRFRPVNGKPTASSYPSSWKKSLQEHLTHRGKCYLSLTSSHFEPAALFLP